MRITPFYLLRRTHNIETFEDLIRKERTSSCSCKVVYKYCFHNQTDVLIPLMCDFIFCLVKYLVSAEAAICTS
jgi:hypothetical protein